MIISYIRNIKAYYKNWQQRHRKRKRKKKTKEQIVSKFSKFDKGKLIRKNLNVN